MEKPNIFQELEFFLKEPINIDIKNILMKSGFDTKSALLGLNSQSIEEIEDYANKNRSVLESTSYENMETFKFKPGHKCVIKHLANTIKLLEKYESDGNMQQTPPEYSLIMKTFIETVASNHGKAPNGFRYADIN